MHTPVAVYANSKLYDVLSQALGGGGTISEVNSPVRLMP
jgi:hypothetical protein